MLNHYAAYNALQVVCGFMHLTTKQCRLISRKYVSTGKLKWAQNVTILHLGIDKISFNFVTPFFSFYHVQIQQVF